MLKQYLTEDLIRLKVPADDWEAAVRAGGELLQEAGKCSSDYIEAMVRTVRELGAYMVLAPGLALAHARPEEGVYALGLSLITLKTPVEFGSKANDPVAVVISFCATDQESHVDLLKALAKFLRVDENQTLLKNATGINQILVAFDD